MDRLYSLIGLAYRANKVLYGVKAMDAIRKNKCYLVVLSDDASDKTKKGLMINVLIIKYL